MGYDCGSAVSGNSLEELIESVKQHALEFHGYTREEVDAPERVAVWEGAIKQSSRPGEIRTPRLMNDEGRDIKPH